MLKRLFHSMRGARVARLNEAGIEAWHRGDLATAERELRAAIAAGPAFAPAYGNLGMVLWEQRRLDEGLATLKQAVSLDPAHVGVRINLANALAIGNRMEDAIAQYREVLRLQPGHPRACANLLRPLLDVCDWDGATALIGDLVGRWRARDATVLDALTPFTSVIVDVPHDLRLAVARRYAERVAERVAGRAPPDRAAARGGRIRIGYASADFHNHATAHLASGLFEHHDRGRFEVHAYSFGIDDGSDYRRRVAGAFEHFHDVRALSHEGIARRIAADGIDILVDLKGYTGESRPEIFALRPAPIQVNYLGYPGTMGARFIDYLVADDVLIGADDERWYDERIVRMPESYQVNDDRQPIDPAPATRAECGLPEDAFVFASFNKHYKIERPVFDVWLRLLQAVPGSVLWLLNGHGERALKRHAQARGVDPARLVFVGKLPKARHLARHRCADLYLDTRICNAHTTASDALWAGLPLLTCTGEGFASRVAASVLRAVGLPQLVTADLVAYEARALELARNPAALRALRDELASNRLSRPLFQTEAFARRLEDAYADMQRRQQAGEAPASFRVA
jgi:predicted O-linked N-acetylglucosamine transferase (SPINDLY family)